MSERNVVYLSGEEELCFTDELLGLSNDKMVANRRNAVLLRSIGTCLAYPGKRIKVNLSSIFDENTMQVLAVSTTYEGTFLYRFINSLHEDIARICATLSIHGVYLNSEALKYHGIRKVSYVELVFDYRKNLYGKKPDYVILDEI